MKKRLRGLIALAVGLTAQWVAAGVLCANGQRGAIAPANVLESFNQRQAAWNAAYQGSWDTICYSFGYLEPADRAGFEPACFGDGTVRPPLAKTVSGVMSSSAENPARLQELADYQARNGRLPPTVPFGMPLPSKVISHYFRHVYSLHAWNPTLTISGPGSRLESKEILLTECYVFPTLIGFFNGVWNTEKAATNGRDRLRREFGTNRNGVPLKLDLFYNQTGCRAGTTGALACLEDVFEVFAQRDRELQGVLSNRWETFWELLSGRHVDSTSLTGRLLQLLGGAGNGLLQLVDSTLTAMQTQLVSTTTRMMANPPTAANTAAHVAKLKTYIDSGHGAVLIAHSQGNLFVNAAYDGVKATLPNANLEVVHVAPASPTLRGEYVLADIDLVINGLRLTGINGVAPSNLNLPTSTVDLSGHMLEATYLDFTRAAYYFVKSMVERGADKL